MKNAFIIHGSYMSPDANWYPWLKQKLEEQGYEVFVPRFPTPEHQSLTSWQEAFEPYRHHVNAETVFIGHSIGCAFILRELENTDLTIAGCIFVAPFTEAIEHEGLNLVNATFLTKAFNWHAIHQHMGRAAVIASSDDPFVAPLHSEKVAELLGVQLIPLAQHGHFTDADGVHEAPFVLQTLEEITTPVPSTEEQTFHDLNEELKYAGIDMSVNPTGDESIPNRDEAYEIKEDDSGMETMYKDIADTINTSSAKAMADMLHEERLREQRKKEKKKKTQMNIVFGILTLLLIVLGVVLIRKGRTYEPEAVVINTKTTLGVTPFRVNESVSFDLTPFASIFQARDGLKELMGQHRVSNKTLLHIFPTIRIAGIERPASIQTFLQSFEVVLPKGLDRSIDKSFTYGLYGLPTEEHAFLMLDITSIDGAFVGMSQWETSMVEDLQDVLRITDTVRQPSLYDQPFADTLLLNTPMRVLRAPTVTRQMDTRIVEKPIEEIPRHPLPDSTLAAITTITDTEIIFAQPDAFLKDLSVGDVITNRSNALSAAFIRMIDDFVLTNDSFTIMTHDVSLRELSADVPEGATLILKPDENGELVKYAQTEEEITTYIEGPLVPVLYWAFLGNQYIVITTHVDVIDAIIERLGEAGHSQ
ncbi:serine hydrolase family protein [Candidatus Nomurabacteria bacterium]|nr:serine hydrolase family protein [Candidatus Nomurabacteria bacterium]